MTASDGAGTSVFELGASVGLDATVVVDAGKVVVDVVVVANFGVTVLEAVEAGLLPITLWATTVKVYSVPLVSPVMLQLSVVALCDKQVKPPGELVAV
jgi:hypothetical protein